MWIFLILRTILRIFLCSWCEGYLTIKSWLKFGIISSSFTKLKTLNWKKILNLNLNLNYNGKTGKIKTYIVDGLSIQKAIEKFILIKWTIRQKNVKTNKKIGWSTNSAYYLRLIDQFKKIINNHYPRKIPISLYDKVKEETNCNTSNVPYIRLRVYRRYVSANKER